VHSSSKACRVSAKWDIRGSADRNYIVIARGQKDAPCLWINAQIHGNKLNNVFVAIDFLRGLPLSDLASVSGTVNPLALNEQQRRTLHHHVVHPRKEKTTDSEAPHPSAFSTSCRTLSDNMPAATSPRSTRRAAGLSAEKALRFWRFAPFARSSTPKLSTTEPRFGDSAAISEESEPKIVSVMK
jgi:hypothetical protein